MKNRTHGHFSYVEQKRRREWVKRVASKIDLTTQFYHWTHTFTVTCTRTRTRSRIHTLRRLIMSLFKFHEMLTNFRHSRFVLRSSSSLFVQRETPIPPLFNRYLQGYIIGFAESLSVESRYALHKYKSNGANGKEIYVLHHGKNGFACASLSHFSIFDEAITKIDTPAQTLKRVMALHVCA